MTQRHSAARLLWARRHLIWRRADWNRVLFTDDSRFTVMLMEDYGFADCCIVEKNRFGGESVMVWGGIMGNRKTDLVFVQGNIDAQRYVADVLNAYALPFIRQHGPGETLMHDNARPHVARATTQFLQQNNVNVMPWPAVSPDLNPIEHIWDQLGRKARAYHQIDNVRDLTRALQQKWRNLPNALVLRYVTSMRRRIIACIKCKWWPHS
ncbi:TCB2-like protein, partial [Mya arenaria]